MKLWVRKSIRISVFQRTDVFSDGLETWARPFGGKKQEEKISFIFYSFHGQPH